MFPVLSHKIALIIVLQAPVLYLETFYLTQPTNTLALQYTDFAQVITNSSTVST